MIFVAGLTLKNLEPRIWDSGSPFFIPKLRAVMVSYADFYRMPVQRRLVMDHGLHQWLGMPDGMKVFLDNGAFYFRTQRGPRPQKQYEEFILKARPDWWPIPQDYIPTPKMRLALQRQCFTRTMEVNREYQKDGFVPVVHIGRFLTQYMSAIARNARLAAKPRMALGGIVPNLLRAAKAMPYHKILEGLRAFRENFAAKEVHVFGIGGNATLHLAALLGVDSVDSSGWRNRAARGLIQLPGTGDRMVADLGNWRGRKLSKSEWQLLKACGCPACRVCGPSRLKSGGAKGFCARATHNLWVLLEEADWITQALANGTYHSAYQTRLDNTIYLPLIQELLKEPTCGAK